METKLQFDSIVEKQGRRYALLVKIYELTDGDESKIIHLEFPQGLDQRGAQAALDYLAGEGLISLLADDAPLLQITHRGVVEVEESIASPTEPTEHFPAQVIQHFHGAVGSVQTGNQNMANVVQVPGGDPEVAKLLKELRRHLADETPERERDSLELWEGLSSEVESPNRSKSRIRLYLEGLGSFVKDTGKDLLVEIGSRLITNQLGTN